VFCFIAVGHVDITILEQVCSHIWDIKFHKRGKEHNSKAFFTNIGNSELF
jgi:hypothetical protein